MTVIRSVFLGAIALSFLACSSTRIQTDYDHEADFGSYSSFAWYQMSTADEGPTAGPSQLVDRRIRSAIASNLTTRGFSQTDADQADLLVTYYTSLSPQYRMHTYGWGYGWGYGAYRGWGGYWGGYGYSYWPGWTTTSVSVYHEGTVIIDVVDRGKNQLVWRGVTTRVLGKKSHSDEKIDQAMSRVFLEFPPS